MPLTRSSGCKGTNYLPFNHFPFTFFYKNEHFFEEKGVDLNFGIGPMGPIGLIGLISRMGRIGPKAQQGTWAFEQNNTKRGFWRHKLAFYNQK